ncbi:MAG: hypothetical protein ACRELS_14190 [Candidatus Rokuibacteriota bacterium]
MALVSTAGAAPKTPPTWETASVSPSTYAAETLERSFRLEWDARREPTATLVSGYVYNNTNRFAARMRLAIAGVDGARVVGASTTWIPDGVPANNRNYFEAWVPNAPAYRVSVLSFDWRERDRRW